MLRALKTNFRSNPNIGLYAYATDEYCLVGPEVPEEMHKEIADILGVPVHVCTIAGTGLVGVFLAGTNETLLIPHITNEHERERLIDLGISYAVIETDHTALGNNLVCTKNGCLASTEYSENERRAISDALGVPVKAFRVGEEVTVIGSCLATTSTGCLAHKGLADFEAAMAQSTLGVPVMLGTVNLGNPYVRSGLIANSYGMLIGDLSGGPEIVNAEEALRGADQ